MSLDRSTPGSLSNRDRMKVYLPGGQIQKTSYDDKEYLNTMGKDTVRYSFSRADRFRQKKQDYESTFVNLPNTLSQRTTNFGFGKRPDMYNKQGRDSPPPTAYNPPSCFDKKDFGPLMGPRPSSQTRNIVMKNLNPGPGTYGIGSIIGSEGPRFSFRRKTYVRPRTRSPPPGTYNPSISLIENKRFHQITFGYGRRKFEFTQDRAGSPGPGTYDLPSTLIKSNINYGDRIKMIGPMRALSMSENPLD